MVMTVGMSRLASTISGPAMFGSRWRSAMRTEDAPRMRSASRNGAVPTTSACARATRANCGARVAATISTTLRVDGPNTATTASARIRLGKAATASNSTSRPRSTQPPARAAVIPSSTPAATARMMAASATRMATRVP